MLQKNGVTPAPPKHFHELVALEFSQDKVGQGESFLTSNSSKLGEVGKFVEGEDLFKSELVWQTQQGCLCWLQDRL